MSRILQARVDEIRPGGIVVNILFDTRKGFVRWRELSWDRRIGFQPQPPPKGQLIEVVQIDEPGYGYYVPLSIRRITDPWSKVGYNYAVGVAVTGEVVNVRHIGAFVQLEPGIDAHLAPSDVPLRAKESIDSCLKIGDKVEATITLFDKSHQLINISVNRRLRDLSRLNTAKRKEIQLAHFKRTSIPNPKALNQPDVSTADTLLAPARVRYHPPLSNVTTVLIVDDDKVFLPQLIALIEEHFQLEAIGVESGDEAMKLLATGARVELAMIDVHLNGETGLFVAQRLLNVQPQMEILFISSVSIAGQDLPHLHGRKPLFASKQTEEITGLVEKLLHGYEEVIETSVKESALNQGLFARQLGINMDSDRTESVSDSVARMVSTVRRESNATYALLIEVEPRTQSAWIITIDPPLTRAARTRTEDGLYYSPARTVAEEDEEYYYVQEEEAERTRELQYFLPQLDFRTCLGVPLHTSSATVRHALFVLDKESRRFSGRQLDLIRFSAQSTQLAIERTQMLDYMRRYEQRYTLGFLLSSLAHELSNKLDGLSTYGESLATILGKLTQSDNLEAQKERLILAAEISKNILSLRDETSELLNSYSRVASNEQEAVNAVDVIHKVKRQFATYAREENVVIEVDIEANLPPARTIAVRLEQILTNMVLNAIQQISNQRRDLMQTTALRETSEPLLRHGLIIIQARLVKRNEVQPLQISVIDTGPGVHTIKREEIFQMGTSMRRQGHGLGLFISRSLVENMGGRLYLADSIMFIGSAFVVELPLAAKSSGG